MVEPSCLDGRNRWLACQIAGVAARFRPYTGTVDEAIKFVMNANLNRRHLLPIEKYEAIDKAHCLREAAKKREQDAYPKNGQRGFQSNVAAELQPHKEESESDRWRWTDDASKLIGVSPRTVYKIQRIEKEGRQS